MNRHNGPCSSVWQRLLEPVKWVVKKPGNLWIFGISESGVNLKWKEWGVGQDTDTLHRDTHSPILHLVRFTEPLPDNHEDSSSKFLPGDLLGPSIGGPFWFCLFLLFFRSEKSVTGYHALWIIQTGIMEIEPSIQGEPSILLYPVQSSVPG